MADQFSKTVMIVDDDRVFLDSLEQFLLQRGYHCKTAWDADSAMKIIRDFTIDVVVADVVMPGKDGIQLMHEAREVWPDLDFVFMTGCANDYSYVDIINAGASDYITKPFDMMELIARIERIEREKRLVVELKNTNKRLHHTVRQVNEMMSEVKQSARAKSNLLANISHEIRTPLTGILGFTDILTATALDNEQMEYAKNIKMSGEVILSLIDDFLDSSKIEAGEMKLEKIAFDPESLCYDVFDLVRPRIYGRPVELLCRTDDALPAMVCGDPYRFRQVLLNLMSNAVKFTDSGEIELDLATHGMTPNGLIEIVVSIRDTGIGIPRADLDNVFEPFRQSSDSVPREYGGTGLGLFIARRIAGLMGGDVWVESEPDKGSTFSFSARMDAAGDGMQPKQFDLPELKGRYVLVADASATNLEIMMHLLETMGVRAESVSTAEGMLSRLGDAAAEGSPFDLCIVELSLVSEVSTNQCPIIEHIRQADTPFRSIPLIAIAEPFLGNAQRCEQAGFDAFMTKPVKREVLFERLQSLIVGKRGEGTGQSLPEPESQETAVSTAGAAGYYPTVLLVEDNPVNQKLIKAMLTKANYGIDLAEDGASALDKIFSGANHYSLILMDVQMPGMDGITTTKEIRRWERRWADVQTDRKNHVPIIAVTAGMSEEKKYFNAGMDDFLAKPIKRDDLLAMLGKWIG
ncbi:MAG: response regulator [Thermodesulfobacteriota bacterium]|nr:response regulator [Thermodesulfobacteriota bacterium]